MTIATDSGGRQRTRTDDLPQATRATALAARAATWLRDEEARGPAHAASHSTLRAWSPPVQPSACRPLPSALPSAALPNLAVLDQGGACGTAGPVSAPGSALAGPPGARRATPSAAAGSPRVPVIQAHARH